MKTYEVLSLKQMENKFPVLAITEWFQSEELSLNTPENVATFLNGYTNIKKLAEEHVFAIPLDNSLKPLGLFIASKGSISCSLINVRGIAIMLLLRNATRVILVHNHPSGSTTPSKQDLDSYHSLKKGLNLLELELIDSVILGNHVTSLRRLNL